jgi:peptidoglycan/LPS O-acetylase OafA/YrhL
MNNRQYYPALDALRFCAALLVLTDHFGLFALNFPSATAPKIDRAFHFLDPMINTGSIGVEIFFLISGFIIPASCLGVSARIFAYRRGIRILPALWISALVALVARLTTGESPWALLGDVARSAILSPIGPYIDGVVWTLVVELVFYVFIFLLIASNNIKNTQKPIIGLGLISATYIAALAVTTLLAPHNPAAQKLLQSLGRFPFKVFLLNHGVFFALGMAIWYYAGRKLTAKTYAFLLLLLTFCSIEIICVRADVRDGLIALAIWLAALFTVAISALFPERASTRLAGFDKVFRQLGLLSYPLYLNHYVLGMVLVAFFGRAGLNNTANFLLSIFIVFAISYFVMRVPERFIQRRLLAGLKKRYVAAAFI